MATANVIGVVSIGITLLTWGISQAQQDRNSARTSFIIANDNAGGPDGGDLSNAGGDLPDIRHWDETIEFLGANYDPGFCDEGRTDCTVDVGTGEAVTYTLFTGNNNAICIAWTGQAWAGLGNGRRYAFHPGNWAQHCDGTPYDESWSSGNWYYAGQQVPGIDNAAEVYCAWVDADGDLDTTGFSVHWPEFNDQNAPQRDDAYYCGTEYGFRFYEENDPGFIVSQGRRRRRSTLAERKPNNATLSQQFVSDTRLIKSHFPEHTASALCDRTRKAAGQSFVSYQEKKFCYMPTKTLYDFCDDIEDGACWDDEKNAVIAKSTGSSFVANDLSVPDLTHIKKVIEWGT
ncbi:hypothetical protein BDW02DRAFT_576716 [Decorospora gaudefroyi]|uniref:Uncharacterized protein n=1 Tax=Decorospora gaudefroyi TaxID=184978 RepID=A0A6A5KPC0_9PLEO|nr:hypothetical protein BDW02DRAFT_576716 [Decorospora gaudefroyi]